MLATYAFGNPDNPTLLMVHGLFGSARNWRAIAKRMSAALHVVTVDMRNHAGSFHSDEMTYAAMAEDLAEVIQQIGAPVAVMGHSMGGKAAMVLAMTRPQLISKLIVADIAPVTYTHDQTPNIDAMEALDLSILQKRSDADAALKAHLDDPGLRAFFLQSLSFDGDRPAWLLNLKALRRSMPDILAFPEMSAQFAGPSLFVTGAQSDYMTPAHKTVTRRHFPAARFVAIKDAGHWLHADQPRAFVATLQAATKSLLG